MNDNSIAPGKRIGRTMLVIGWIIFFIGLTYVLGGLQDHQYNPNQSLSNRGSDNIVEISLKRNKYHHYVAKGKVNGKPVVFMLDTGATDVAIPLNMANRLGLIKGAQGRAMTANGVVQIWKSNIAALELGPIKLFDVRASINPGMSGNEILLGMSALKQLEFTQRGNELTIKQYN